MANPPPIPTLQKFVTVYLDNSAYTKGEFLKCSLAEQHGKIEQHLAAELAEGWRVISISGFGGNSEGISVRGWFAVILEKP